MAKILVATNDGTVIEIIEDVEDYDLSKSMGKAALLSEIEPAIERAKGKE